MNALTARARMLREHTLGGPSHTGCTPPILSRTQLLALALRWHNPFAGVEGWGLAGPVFCRKAATVLGAWLAVELDQRELSAWLCQM